MTYMFILKCALKLVEEIILNLFSVESPLRSNSIIKVVLIFP